MLEVATLDKLSPAAPVRLKKLPGGSGHAQFGKTYSSETETMMKEPELLTERSSEAGTWVHHLPPLSPSPISPKDLSAWRERRLCNGEDETVQRVPEQLLPILSAEPSSCHPNSRDLIR